MKYACAILDVWRKGRGSGGIAIRSSRCKRNVQNSNTRVVAFRRVTVKIFENKFAGNISKPKETPNSERNMKELPLWLQEFFKIEIKGHM